jgi:hypothetical protein
MFEVGDLIKHRKEEKYYIIVKKKIITKIYEIITFEAIRIDDESEKIIMHHPLMTSYFERVNSSVDIEK